VVLIGPTTTLHVPTLVEEVARSLRELILQGEFQPGERLIEEQLSERFGVSRPPLREAMRVLSQDGLIVARPRRGYTVVTLTRKDVEEIYSLRFSLERLAVELALPVADPEALKPLEAAVARMRDPRVQKDRVAMVEANADFHRALVALPDHARLKEAYHRLNLQLTLCMAVNLEFRQGVSHDPGDPARRHQKLLDLVRAGDVKEVVEELGQHGDRSFLSQVEQVLRVQQPAGG
jgi:DNA-binding GntR family transcriptional regulator